MFFSGNHDHQLACNVVVKNHSFIIIMYQELLNYLVSVYAFSFILFINLSG